MQVRFRSHGFVQQPRSNQEQPPVIDLGVDMTQITWPQAMGNEPLPTRQPDGAPPLEYVPFDQVDQFVWT